MLGHYVIGKRRRDDKPDDGDAFGCCCGWLIGGLLLLALSLCSCRIREVPVVSRVTVSMSVITQTTASEVSEVIYIMIV